MGHISKALLVSVVLAMLVIAAIPLNASAVNGSIPTVDLIAGGGNLNGAKDVGDVTYWVDGSNLYIHIVTTGGWYFTSTEVEVKTSVSAIPQANGNPIPGKFSYKKTETGTDTNYVIPISSTRPLYIAVHANVQKGGLTGVALALPDTATIQVAGGTVSFGRITITNGGILNGVYNGWCVDTGHSITPGNIYTADVYSSLESLPGGVVDKPQNLDLVNWLLNQNYFGKIGPTGVPISKFDIQMAIWSLIDNTLPTYPPVHTDANVNAIVTAALANGEGFVPGPGQIMAIILKPSGPPEGCAQVLIIEFPVPGGCGSETAWASKITKDGAGKITSMNIPFPGKNWATYFTYPVT